MEQTICRFIESELAIEPNSCTPSTRLFDDLGVTGVDAGDLMEAFAKQFHVDLSDFDFHRYFRDEPSWADHWRDFRGIKLSPLEPLAVSELVRAAESGKWVQRDIKDAEGN